MDVKMYIVNCTEFSMKLKRILDILLLDFEKKKPEKYIKYGKNWKAF